MSGQCFDWYCWCSQSAQTLPACAVRSNWMQPFFKTHTTHMHCRGENPLVNDKLIDDCMVAFSTRAPHTKHINYFSLPANVCMTSSFVGK